jgi:prepilin-type N-terminal cleavage/methylation domain-containing protein
VRRAAEQHGFSLVELLVAMALAVIVFAAAATLLVSYLKDSGYAQRRTESQAAARTAIDRISRELRTAVAPSNGSAVIEYETSYDLVFREVSTTSSVHQKFVRFCVDNNETLWRQTKDLQTTSDSTPDTSSCPSGAWTAESALLGGCQSNSAHCARVVNRLDSDPLFSFGPTGWSSTAGIRQVDVSLHVNENLAGAQPGPSELTSGIYLRNNLEDPVVPSTGLASVSGSGNNQRYVTLDGSGAYDPNGQALSYQWYEGTSCPSPAASDELSSGANDQEPPEQGPYSSGQTLTYVLVVTDTAGLTGCGSISVTT